MKPILLINPNRSEQTTEAMLRIVRQRVQSPRDADWQVSILGENAGSIFMSENVK